MSREEAIEVLNGIEEVYGALPEDGNKIDEALSMAIKALEQEPCEDAISRSAAIKAIDERAKRIKNEDTLNGLAGAVGVLFDLPSVKPQEPKTGHWVKTPNNKYMWYCDKCEYLVYQDSSRTYPSEKYCPNCGCRMILPFA